MKKQIASLCILLTILLLAACGKKKTDAAFALTIGLDASSNSINPMISIAQARGYFSDYDISPTLQPVDRGGLFESVSIGKLDGSVQDILANLGVGARGGDIMLYAGTMSGGQAVMAYKDFADGAEDVNNWKGRTVGVLMGGTAEMVAKRALPELYGLVVDTDVTFKLFDRYESLLAAGSKGIVDIACMWNSYVETAQSMGMVYMFPVTNWKDDFVCCRQMANGTNFKKNREAYVAWLKALIRGYKDYVTDEDGSTDILEQFTGQDRNWITATIYDKKTTQNLTYNPDPNFNGVNDYYDTMIEYGYIQTDRPLTEFFDISVYADALREMIRENPTDDFYKAMWPYFVNHNNHYPNFAKDYPAQL